MLLKIKSLEKELSRFGLLLKRKKITIEIIDVDNNNKTIHVLPPADLDTRGEKTDDSLQMSRGGNIRINLIEIDEPSLTPNIDIYQKEIYVCSKKFPYLVKGYVIYDGLELVPNRENYKDKPEFSTILDKYLAMHYKVEYIPRQPKLERNELKQIHEILSEVLTTISKVHGHLLPNLIGDWSSDGVPGKAANREQSEELTRRDNVQYVSTGSHNGSEIYPRGQRKKITKKIREKHIKAKTGKSQDEGIQDGGRYSVEVKVGKRF